MKLISYALAALLPCLSSLALAQGLTLTPSTGLSGYTGPDAAQTQTADYILAVVHAEPVTYHEVRQEVQRVIMRATAQGRSLPDAATLEREVLERLIDLRIQLQWARESGIRADDNAIDDAERNVAAQSQITLAELHRRVQSDGLSLTQFREQLRDQILLQRLREREVDSRVRISEADIDQYLQDQTQSADPSRLAINLMQVLVPVPEDATPEQVAALSQRAQALWQRAQAGADFAALARETAGVDEAAVPLGLRALDRYPDLFVQAVKGLPEGGVAAPVRSGAGFHVLKLLQRVNPDMPQATRVQHHARHILLVPSAGLSAEAARTQLTQWRSQIVAGQADFASLAREHSQDGSATQGGDLGWVDLGVFVPEFEAAMVRLRPGEISEPLVSRFGVHLIQLMDRREQTLTLQQQREAVRALLRERRAEEQLGIWLDELRARTYIERRAWAS